MAKKKLTIVRGWLKKIGKAVLEFDPCINYGGCAVYTAAVAKELTELGCHVSVAVSTSWRDDDEDIDLRTARSNIRENGGKVTSIVSWNDEGVWFGHVFIELHDPDKDESWFVDTTKIVAATTGRDPTYKWKPYPGRMTLMEVEAIASRQTGWNEEFNRRNIPAIKRLIKRGFKRLKQDLEAHGYVC